MAADLPSAPVVAGRLLILDDDELVGLLVQTIGSLAALQTQLTARPEDFFAALSRPDAPPPTHLVIDLTLPGMAGEQVLRELAMRQCRASVVICSGTEPQRLADAAALAAALGLVVAGTLAKPFRPAALRLLLGQGPAS